MNILCLFNYFLNFIKQLTFIFMDIIRFSFFVFLFIMLNKTIENVISLAYYKWLAKIKNVVGKNHQKKF